ncbi:MAG: T9SS type A sorting domain-containing protein [Fidelibacterota bacterium]
MVQLRVFNFLGEQVAVLVNRRLAPGKYTTAWNPENLASGIYLYELRIGGGKITQKMMLVK